MSKLFFAVMCMMFLAACGGGSGGGSNSSTSVSGVASKGPIISGAVNVYAVNADGSRGKLIGTAQTSSTDGSYQVASMDYSGSIIVAVTGGTYVDEATGATLPNPGLKAALPGASGTVQIAVTPLTDVAFKQMSSATGGLSSANITNCNALVSTAFGVDIIGTQPVNATNAVQVSGAKQAAIDYGVALAAISQMVKSGSVSDVKDAISKIKGDLSGATPQLTTTGAAFSNAIATLIADNKLAPTITAATISVDDSVKSFTDNPVVLPANPGGVAQAKGLVRDLRNTVLAVVDTTTGEVTSAIRTPFDATVKEIQTVVEPELTTAGDRLGWMVTSAGSIQSIVASHTYTFTDTFSHPGETLTFVTDATGLQATVKVASASATLASGTISVNQSSFPTSGSISLTTMKTATGNATASVTFSGTKTGLIYTGLTLKGNITTPVASFDFSDISQGKLEASFATVPGNDNSAYLTKASFKGVATTPTARLTGSIDLPNLVWNTSLSGNRMSIPTSATVSAKIEALSNGNATMTLDGTLSGTFSNAATYNANAPDSASNFPNWTGTFNGSVVASSGLNISVLLKASMPAYEIVNFEAKYTRVLADGSSVFLSSTGTSNNVTKVTTLAMSNQNGLQVAISFDNKLSGDNRLSGTIKTGGNETVGNFSSVKGIPRVTYADNFFETLI
jgi:hypothetical protein